FVFEVPADQQHVVAGGGRGEDAGGGHARGDGRGVRGPGRGVASVHEDARRTAAGHDDASVPWRGRDTGATRRERRLVLLRRRHALRLQRPAPAAVGRFVDLEGAVDRITHQPAALAVEGHAVEEGALVVVLQ